MPGYPLVQQNPKHQSKTQTSGLPSVYQGSTPPPTQNTIHRRTNHPIHHPTNHPINPPRPPATPELRRLAGNQLPPLRRRCRACARSSPRSAPPPRRGAKESRGRRLSSRVARFSCEDHPPFWVGFKGKPEGNRPFWTHPYVICSTLLGVREIWTLGT